MPYENIPTAVKFFQGNQSGKNTDIFYQIFTTSPSLVASIINSVSESNNKKKIKVVQWNLEGKTIQNANKAAEDEVRKLLKPSSDGSSRPGIFWKIPDASVSINSI